jgi:hypothetical protein
MPDRDDSAAITVLIARVDRLERVLRNVRAAMPWAPPAEAMRETMAGPSDGQRLSMVGAALQELGDWSDSVG